MLTKKDCSAHLSESYQLFSCYAKLIACIFFVILGAIGLCYVSLNLKYTIR